MKILNLGSATVAGILAAAVPFSGAEAGSKISPKPNRIMTGPRELRSYRLYDDAKGISSGSRFSGITSIMERGSFRIGGDAHDIVIEDCDLTIVKPTEGSDLPVGIDLRGTVHDVVIRRVVSHDHKMVPVEGKYANGDGFSTEWNVRDIVFEDDEAVGNGDGGFDTKGEDLKFIRTKSSGNGRNYRAWGANPKSPNWHPTRYVYDNVESRNPGNAHFWIGKGTPDITLINPKFFGPKPHLKLDFGRTDSEIKIVGGSIDGKPITGVSDLRIDRAGTGSLTAVRWEPRRPTP